MATGSKAAGKARLQGAQYWTGASSANAQPRCDNCAWVEALPQGAKQHGRWCGLHGAAVRTHGCCSSHNRATPAQGAAK